MKGYSWFSFLWTVDSLVEADPPEVMTSNVSLPADGVAALGIYGELGTPPAEDVATNAGCRGSQS